MVKGSSLKGHEQICVHFVFDVKHDKLHEAMLVTDGHLTDIPIFSVCLGVISLQGIRLVIFIAELNKLDSLVTGIRNACLEEFTKEKVYIKCGQEFGPIQVHTLIIKNASCGLRTSVL